MTQISLFSRSQSAPILHVASDHNVSRPASPESANSALSRGSSMDDLQVSDKTMKAQLIADRMRTLLGVPLPGGVMSKCISKNNQPISIEDVMKDYAKKIDSILKPKELATYINMGERLIQSINKSDSVDKILKVEVEGKNGDKKTMNVGSNLETTRAISWYLQAKAVLDNASDARKEPVLLYKGSMVMNDPKGKLYKFLASAPNSYGRVSTHYNNQSLSGPANIYNTGAAGAAAALLDPGKKAQKGIEDFGKRMPSGKGALIFDQLKGHEDQTQLFLKWETKGMPTVFGKSKHADSEEGNLKLAQNKLKAFGACVGHAINFAKTKAGKNHESKHEARREDVHKGSAAEHFHAFGKVIKDNTKMKIAKEQGLSYIKKELHNMPPTRQDSIELLSRIKEFETQMGNDLGIHRKGAEVHVSLDTEYLPKPEPSSSSSNARE